MCTCGALVAVEIYATINDFKAQRSTQQKKREAILYKTAPICQKANYYQKIFPLRAAINARLNR